MLTSRTRGAGLLASLAALAVLAVAASPASAWNTETGGVKLTGTLTLKKAGKEAVKCTFPTTGQSGAVSENWYESKLPTVYGLSCEKSSLPWEPRGMAWQEEGSGALFAEVGAESYWRPIGPYGSWLPTEPVVKSWVNASGGTASHVTLSEDQIGVTQSLAPITASGTIYFTTLSGGNLTLP